MALGRTNARRPGGSAPKSRPQQPEQPDNELDSYLAALAPEESTETTGTGQRFGGSQVYQLRLPLMANERLKELAARQGTSPAALAREWVLQHLSSEPQQTPQPPQQAQQQAEQAGWPEEPVALQPTQPQQPVAQPPQQQQPVAQPPQQQYSGDLRAAHDQYVPAETDTEITVPRGQQYYGG